MGPIIHAQYGEFGGILRNARDLRSLFSLNGKTCHAVGCFTENVQASSWPLLEDGVDACLSSETHRHGLLCLKEEKTSCRAGGAA